ncbi:Tetratricopeptide TPR_2 repeat protein [Methylotenera mobilis JLW8]|uniref:Tetratricopeptide TPR_2 repeat protein n=2 Tax=Methylotenera mobilis TaxID=359408 RepID=C6WWJ8_METML|nr:Tetratricopeptide TPR_2 repeat protein [Methylotenera mobilis JLW8]
MKSKRKILPMACCVAILSACASNQQVSEAPSWAISPNVKTSNAQASANAMYKLGRYYQGQRRDELAIEAYQKSIYADASFVEAYNGLGVIYAKHGKYQKAIEAFKSALNYAPAAAHLYSNMGYAYYLQGQYAEAVATLKQATTLDPTNLRALNNLGMAYAKSGSQGESVQAFTQAISVEAKAADAEAPVQNALAQEHAADQSEAKPTNVSEIFTAKVSTPKVIAPQADVQELVLPKNQGVVRSAPLPGAVPVVDSSVTLVQVAPNVFELQSQQLSAMPMQQAEEAVVVNWKQAHVEVSNGNGVTGMAGQVGKFLLGQGYQVTRLTNQKPFNVKRSQIQYRDGHHDEAKVLKDSLPDSPDLVQRNDLRADVGVRVVLGNDMRTHVAYFGTKQDKTQLALTLNKPKT